MATKIARPTSGVAYNSATLANLSASSSAFSVDVGLVSPRFLLPITSGVDLSGFDFSEVPSSAVINDIDVVITGYTNNSSALTSFSVQLYYASASNFTNSVNSFSGSSSTATVNVPYREGTTKWTGAELQDSSFFARITGAPTASGVVLYIQDIYLVVTYTSSVVGVFRPSSYTTPYSGLAFGVSNWAHSAATTADLTMSESRNSVFDILFNFDTSAIPDNATIESVGITWTGYTNSAARFIHTYLGVIANGTEVSTASCNDSSTTQTTTFSNLGLTLSQLRTLGVRFYTTHDSSLTGYYYLTDCYATIHYSVPVTQSLKIKKAGVWASVTAVYEKVGGVWTAQADLQSVFSTAKKYIRGN